MNKTAPTTQSKWRYMWTSFLVFLILSFLAALAGVIATGPNIETWYRDLMKPSWTPPDYIFGPVWSALYLLMAIAAWLVWLKRDAAKVIPMTLFVIQLILNAAWTWFFFHYHNPDMAFAEIIVLWFAILGTMITFWKERPIAGVLMFPYIAWVSFATVLNFSIMVLN
jgi:benzodiazapine receptor